jgi:nucleoside-diphosphate-sugar epimerase
MSKKILITGSSGFIGTHLKKVLLSKNYSIAEFNSAQGDIASTHFNFAGIDYVIHLAGRSFVPDSWKDPEEFRRVNVVGTENVLEFCRKNKIPMMFMSSYVYGIPERLPINELHPVHPSNPYASSKYAAERICLSYAMEHSLPVTIVRPFNIFGLKQPQHFLIPEIIKQAADKSVGEIRLMDLTPRRDYIYMDDFLSALTLLLEKGSTGIFNVGSGYSLSVKEIAEIILCKSAITKEIISLKKSRPNEIPNVIADISKITGETGWKPKITFEEGIERIVASEKN